VSVFVDYVEDLDVNDAKKSSRYDPPTEQVRIIYQTLSEAKPSQIHVKESKLVLAVTACDF
ncbi:hypothetical protein EUTSA_v10009543mg, partial [Eutrema salsugineum]